MSESAYNQDFEMSKDVALIKAISLGDLKAIRTLAGEGGNLNVVGKHENTPLRVAVKLKQKQVVRLLFQLGVDPNTITPGGVVAAADDAVTEKDPDFLSLFLEFGLDPNLKCQGMPLIFFALSRQNWIQYEMLLSSGADINSKLPDGSSLLLDLVMHMEYDRAKDLLLRGAEFRVRSSHGFNVLGQLVDDQRRLCIDPDLPDCHKRAELLRLLRERGATVPPGLPYM
ncbi:ankyrin repeat domain-containing protein [Geomonas terrae]|uniref:Ankyrin repeat domain-containing protein n=1 Tax=Geomonas terrae TaxID=2562681 RepID=A0A4S1CBA1_9BACT|nr:ankyrin repeat domain-containing protein [Geomonas terrae]TGU70625.1 ankyrin repeat domain-containing protein [Geomonas terrae]